MDLGMQIREVAQATGIDEKSIIHWEKGQTRPRKDLLGRLEEFYESK
jgi:transcriptional regulator with XRE-family HTH domain